MAENSYFQFVPDFNYVNRLNGAKNLSEFIDVKNLFKRVKLRDNIFQNLVYFDRYKVIDDERPDNVAFKLYNDPNLDWLIMLSNNIINYESEWPLSQDSLYNYMLSKYGSESNFDNVHHYETLKVMDSISRVIVDAGITVSQDYTVSFYDTGLGITVTKTDAIKAVTNYEYEQSIQTDKRNIFVLKEKYLATVLDDLDELLNYTKGSSQYVSETLVRGSNIRLYS